MKKLSIWAKNHPWPARLMIVLSHFLLLVLAYYLGLITASEDIYLSPFMIKIFGVLFSIACILYPIKGVTKGIFRHSYVRQKSADFVITLTTFLMYTCAFNELCFSPEAIYWKAQPEVVKIVHKTSEARENTFPTMKDVKRAVKKFTKKVRKDMRASKKRVQEYQGSKENKIAPTILVLIGAFILFFLLSSLSCSLSCNGQGGLAITIFIVGLVAIINLTVIAIKAIWRKKKALQV